MSSILYGTACLTGALSARRLSVTEHAQRSGWMGAPARIDVPNVARKESARILVLGKRARWRFSRASFGFLEVHSLNQTVHDGMNVPHLGI